MFLSGMTSVTFRKYDIKTVVSLAKKAGLCGIEWGGDVHVPPMDKSAALEAVSRCRDDGIAIFSYGSYFSPTKAADFSGEFEKAAETCKLLGAERVRIWAGEKWFDETTEEEYRTFLERMNKVSALAREYGVTVCFEHHQNTLCDRKDHALKVLQDIGQDNVRTYWQPIQAEEGENLSCIETLKQYVDTIHVYHWRGWDRFMLSEGREHWKKYLSAFRGEKRNIPCLLEFCKDDSDENFFADAECLHELISEA